MDGDENGKEIRIHFSGPKGMNLMAPLWIYVYKARVRSSVGFTFTQHVVWCTLYRAEILSNTSGFCVSLFRCSIIHSLFAVQKCDCNMPCFKVQFA